MSGCHSNGDRRVISRLSFHWRVHYPAIRQRNGSCPQGEIQPPFESLDPSLGVVFDEHAAHATGRVLLEGIKAALGAEGEMFQNSIACGSQKHADPRLTTGWKASSSGETYVRRESDK